MKISYHWLKDYVSPGLPAEKLAHKLTMAGLEVEKITAAGGDTLFELEITPNRPDCLSMLGIAREAAAILNKPKTFPKITKRAAPKKKCPIRIDDKKGCLRYVGTVIENVSVGRAQDKIIQRLGALGMKPINNIVDITNFCLMETGQPLHAFDYDKLAGGQIIVRKAKQGEKITTLDGVERKLDPSIIVIADAKKPVAIAGIMGGQNTEVTASTKNILLESAYFDQVQIRRASHKLGLSSDSSYRFERGVDFDAVEDGSARAVDLILASAGGRITQRNDVKSPMGKTASLVISTTAEKINHYIGSSLPAPRIKTILTKLGCAVTGSGRGSIKIRPPSFRGDIGEFADVVEEIARIVGYDNLPMRFPQTQTANTFINRERAIRQCVAGMLIAQGLNEVITYTMINQKDLEKSNQADLKPVPILNPLTQDQEIMRPSLLPSLMSVVQFNVNRGQKDLKYFETGKIYTSKGEKEVLGIVLTGVRADNWREPKFENVDYYDLKGIIEGVYARADARTRNIGFEPNNAAFFARGEGATITQNGKAIGVAGRVDQGVVRQWGIKQGDVCYAQIDLESLYGQDQAPVRYRPVSEFPTVSRDISLAVPGNVRAVDIERSIRQTAKSSPTVKLANIKFVELYEGDKIAKDRRGLIYSLTYESRQAKTLRDEEVENVHTKVCKALIDDLGVTQR